MLALLRRFGLLLVGCLMRRAGNPDTTHPDDLLTHLRVEHRLGLRSIPDDMAREVLEMAHAQRHDGFGVGADHAADNHQGGGFS